MNLRLRCLLRAACLTLFLAAPMNQAVSETISCGPFGDGAPDVLDRVAPIYPEQAIRNRLEGAVLVRCLVGKDGRVLKRQPVRGEPLFLKAAETALRQWRFAPPEWDGKSIAVWILVPIRFELSSLITTRLESSDTTRVFVLRSDSSSAVGSLDRVEGYGVERQVELRSPKGASRLFALAVQDSSAAAPLSAPRYAITFRVPAGRIVALVAPDRSLAQLREGGRTWTAPWTKFEADALAQMMAAGSSRRP
jgi:TonB family protein